jgi:hypothetical protein
MTIISMGVIDDTIACIEPMMISVTDTEPMTLSTHAHFLPFHRLTAIIRVIILADRKIPVNVMNDVINAKIISSIPARVWSIASMVIPSGLLVSKDMPLDVFYEAVQIYMLCLLFSSSLASHF